VKNSVNLTIIERYPKSRGRFSRICNDR